MAPRPTTTTVSVGHYGRTAEELVRTLAQSKVKVLVDVRLTPVSRKKGPSKNALAAALAEAGIEYLHEPGLGAAPRAIARSEAGSALRRSSGRRRAGKAVNVTAAQLRDDGAHDE